MSCPYDQAKAVYQKEPCARTFEEDLRLHFRFGFVFSGPDYFLMGRAVEKGAPEVLVLDPTVVFHRPDAWLVYLAAGRVDRFAALEPHPLEWVGWQRDNVLQWWKMDRVKRLCRK